VRAKSLEIPRRLLLPPPEYRKREQEAGKCNLNRDTGVSPVRVAWNLESTEFSDSKAVGTGGTPVSLGGVTN